MTSSFKFRHFYPAVIWSLLILIVSYSVGGLNLPPTLFDVFETDKVGHFGIYTILNLLILIGLQRSDLLSKSTKIKALLWCCFYGFLMEVLQYYFFPGRYFEFPDIVANISGSIAGLIFFEIFIRRFKIF